MYSTPLISLLVMIASGRCLAMPLLPIEPDKSGYSLIDPTPDSMLRDFDTDRPDKTNSPHTLDAGRIQIETGVLGYTRNEDSGIRTENWTWADTTLRIGLTEWAEMQLEIPFYQSNSATDPVSRETARSSGTGDLSVYVKTNFWGNDTGDTAGGMEFFVKFPTANHGLSNGKTEGGALFLFDTKLPGDFDCGINNGVGISANDQGGYMADIINSISVSHLISGPLSGYVEFFSSIPTQHSGDWEGTVDVGLLLMIGKNLQLDAGLNLGVTHGADDLQPFLGVSNRF